MAEEEKVKEPSEFVEHMKAAGRAAGNQWKCLIPKDFWEYGREARREMLLAMRTLVDGAIERLEGAEETKKNKSSRKKAKVSVE